jgi:hypothetical protein
MLSIRWIYAGFERGTGCSVLTRDRRRLLDERCLSWRTASPVRLGRLRDEATCSEEVSFRDTLRRMGGLASVLEVLQRRLHENPGLYHPVEVGAIVNALVRAWPRVTPALCSEEAATKDSGEIMGEHDLPISFFRDILCNSDSLSERDWHYLIARYLRVREISKRENYELGKSFKQNRPVDAYQKVGIRMTEASRQLEMRFGEAVEAEFRDVSEALVGGG